MRCDRLLRQSEVDENENSVVVAGCRGWAGCLVPGGPLVIDVDVKMECD